MEWVPLRRNNLKSTNNIIHISINILILFNPAFGHAYSLEVIWRGPLRHVILHSAIFLKTNFTIGLGRARAIQNRHFRHPTWNISEQGALERKVHHRTCLWMSLYLWILPLPNCNRMGSPGGVSTNAQEDPPTVDRGGAVDYNANNLSRGHV